MEGEQKLEMERIAHDTVAAWKQEHAGEDMGLNEIAPLISAIDSALKDARQDHNELYVLRLAKQFVNETDGISIKSDARRILDELLTEAIREYGSVLSV